MLDDEQFQEQLADTHPVDRDLVDAVRVGEIEYLPADPDRDNQLREEMTRTADASPADVDESLVVITVRLPLGLVKQIREYAASHGIKPGPLMRAWIEECAGREAEPNLVRELDQVVALINHVRRNLPEAAA